MGTIDVVVPFEMVQAKWVSGKEPKSSDMPIRWKTKTAGVVHDSDTNRVVFNRSNIINPGSGFAPRSAIFVTIGIENGTTCLLYTSDAADE